MKILKIIILCSILINIYFCLGIAEENRSGQLYIKGRTYQQEGKYKESFKYIKEAYDSNNKDAALNLGLMYYNGKGVEKDQEKAEFYLLKALDSGVMSAHYFLARLYFVSNVNQDYEKAYFHISNYINGTDDESLHKDAPRVLGLMLLRGIGVEKNIGEAVAMFEKGASLGSVHSMLQLGNLYLEGRIIPVDYNEALKYFTIASDKGNAAADYYISSMYHNGLGVKKDHGKYYDYLIRSSQGGFSFALYQLGILHLSDRDLYDFDKALYFFQAADDAGLEFAGYFLRGLKYQFGYGVPVDKNKSKEFMLKYKEKKKKYKPNIVIKQMNQTIDDFSFIK